MPRCAGVTGTCTRRRGEQAHDVEPNRVAEHAKHRREVDVVGARMMDGAWHVVSSPTMLRYFHEFGSSRPGRQSSSEARSSAALSAADQTAPGWPFALVAITCCSRSPASTMPTPLYGLYQAQWHFSPLSLTEVYAAYAIGVLVALVLASGLSDAIGRQARAARVARRGCSPRARCSCSPTGSCGCTRRARCRASRPDCSSSAASAALIDLHPRRDGAHAGFVNGLCGAGAARAGRRPVGPARAVRAGSAPADLPRVRGVHGRRDRRRRPACPRRSSASPMRASRRAAPHVPRTLATDLRARLARRHRRRGRWAGCTSRSGRRSCASSLTHRQPRRRRAVRARAVRRRVRRAGALHHRPRARRS